MFEKLRYWLALWRKYAAQDRACAEGIAAFGAVGIRDYEGLMRRHAGRGLAGSRALEIGHGQRPFRLFRLAALGCDVRGIDLEVPVLAGAPREILETLRRNGWERALKSAVRAHFFDRRAWRSFERAVMREAGRPPLRDRARLLVGDAADPAVWRRIGGAVDLIYSEDVFEHIPEADLRRVLALMAGHLRPDGIAIISPMIFTGISGGHSPEWLPARVDRDVSRRSEPWEHLRADRFPAGTCLNRLPRRAWRDLFAERFEIIEETPLMPELGRRYLTPDIREELASYPEEELFSNKVRFVLRGLRRPRPHAGPPSVEEPSPESGPSRGPAPSRSPRPATAAPASDTRR